MAGRGTGQCQIYLALKREYEAFQALRIQEQLQDAITCQKHRPL